MSAWAKRIPLNPRIAPSTLTCCWASCRISPNIVQQTSEIKSTHGGQLVFVCNSFCSPSLSLTVTLFHPTLSLSPSLPPFTWCFSDTVLKSVFFFFDSFKAWSLNTQLLCCQPTLCQRESACAWQQGEDEGARAGGRVSRANILFTLPFAHAHTHAHQAHSQNWTKETQKWAASSTHTGHVFKNSSSQTKIKQPQREIDLNPIMYSVKQLVFAWIIDCVPLWSSPHDLPLLAAHSPVNLDAQQCFRKEATETA